MRRAAFPTPGRRRGGFTLVELLVVMLIILLLSAVMLPVILPAINGRRIESASGIVYGELTRMHDEAVRANAPRGIRLLPDAFDPERPDVLTSSRLIGIETGPDYQEGLISAYFQTPPYNTSIYQPYPPPATLPQYQPNGMIPYSGLDDGSRYPYLVVREEKWQNIVDPTTGNLLATIPHPPTMWFYNIRQGDKLRISGSSTLYTIAGPTGNPAVPENTSTPYIRLSNPDRLVNFGPGYLSTPMQPGTDSDGDGAPNFEFLYLVNGHDDDGDGYTDEGFDGLNNDGDYYPSGPFAGQPVIDPGFNGIDDNGDGQIDDPAELYLHIDANGNYLYPGNPFGLPDGGYTNGKYSGPLPNEYERETFIPSDTPAVSRGYSIARRPVLSTKSREVALPTNVVVDLTTWSTTRERSRLPVDPYSHVVDILVYPDGRVTTMSANGNVTTALDLPFYHIWLSELEDVAEPRLPENPGIGQLNTLPMSREAIPNETNSYGANKRTEVYPADWPTLQADRRLISINTQTGQILTNTIESFDPSNLEVPYRAAQLGIKEEQ